LHSLFHHRYKDREGRGEQIKILTFILDKHIFNLNDYNKDGLSIIQFAVTLGDLPIEALELLIKYGADPYLKTITETSFKLWSEEYTILPAGISTIDIFRKKKMTLISEYEKGLVSEELYYNQGMEYFEKAIRILESGN
jgi:hypothetical protein